MWLGVGIGLMNAGLNHYAQEINENMKLRKYINKMFPNRIPKGASVRFSLYDGNGEIKFHKTYREVCISREFWFDKDNRLLIDSIDHELVHLDDIESGRYNRYIQLYKEKAAISIMEFKAYSENQYYNLHFREPHMRIDYSAQINEHKAALPYGWWTVK